MQKYLPRIHVCTTESFPRHQYDLCNFFDQCLSENKCTLYRSQQILYIPWVNGKWNLCLKLILINFFQKTHTRKKTTTTTAKQEQNAEKMKYLTHVFPDVWLIMLQHFFFLEPPSNFVKNLPLVSLGLF